MMDWQPIESAPNDGTHILAFGWGYSRDSTFGIREIWRKWNPTYRYVPAENGLYRREDCRSDDHWEPERAFNPVYWIPRPETPSVEDL